MSQAFDHCVPGHTMTACLQAGRCLCPPEVADTRVFAHRFQHGEKTDDTRCACGQKTWREAVEYWRTRPRREVLQQDVLWCDAREQ